MRELLEEVGCLVDIVRPLGVVIEYRESSLKISYGFVVTVKGDIGEVSLTESEKMTGHVTEWVTPEACLETLRQEES